MGDSMELHGVTGKPYSHPQVRKKLPAPFSRQRIDLDGGRHVKRTWQDLAVTKVKKDDIVAGFGRVDSVHETIIAGDGKHVLTRWTVRLTNVLGDYQDYPGEQRVYVFAPEQSS